MTLESAVSQRGRERFTANEEKSDGEGSSGACVRVFVPNFDMIFYPDPFTVLADQEIPVQ